MKKTSTKAQFAAVCGSLLIGACVADTEFDDSTPSFDGPDVADSNTDLPDPVVDNPDGIPEPVVTVMAEDLSEADNLLLTDRAIHWTEEVDGKAVLKWQHKDGGNNVIADVLSAYPFSMVSDDDGLYFASTTASQIDFASHLGLESDALFADVGTPLAVELSAEFAYWTTEEGCLYQGSKAGDSLTKLSCIDGTPTTLAVFDDHAIWATAEGDLYRSSFEAGPAELLANGQSFGEKILSDGEQVFWVDSVNREVRAFNIESQTFATVADRQYSPSGITMDRFFIYFASQADGSIRRVRKSGVDEPLVMVKGQSFPSDIVADDEFLYWLNEGDDTLRRMAK